MGQHGEKNSSVFSCAIFIIDLLFVNIFIKLSLCIIRCGSRGLGIMDIYGAEFDWISMWLLSVISGWLTYTCARTAAKVHIQVRIMPVPDKSSTRSFSIASPWYSTFIKHETLHNLNNKWGQASEWTHRPFVVRPPTHFDLNLGLNITLSPNRRYQRPV